MKRLLSFLMAIALVLSMTATVFAAEDTGSITVTNATVGHTYAPFLIFDATIVTGTSGNADGVAYSIEEDNQFFDDLFENPKYVTTTDPHYNPFFVYNPNTGSVVKRDGVNDGELIAHLKDLIYEEVERDTDGDGDLETVLEVKSGLQAAADAVDATSDTVEFEDLPYGYYLITSTLGTTVTINSNTPDVEVIDKNQEPASDFEKQVQVGVDENGDPIWADANSASVGDKVTYKIEFTATNYDGDLPIKYYQVHDEKGNAIWAEFDSFKVTVGGVELKKGYYLNQGGDNTNDWLYLGDWSDVPEAERDVNDADWYLVHIGYDKFRITIPWMEGHTITTGSGNPIDNETSDTYTVNFPADAAHKFDSPSVVVITYDAAIESTAAIGPTPTEKNRFNKAEASWTSATETGTTPPDEVETKVYGIGLLKDDLATHQNLPGAKFRVYKDAACTDEVFVIPTEIEGVYMVDSKGTDIEGISGTMKVTAREYYEDLYAARGEDYATTLAKYLVDDEGNAVAQNNLVVTPVNGKVIVLGLEAGDYYMLEVEAPAGYNALTAPVKLSAGTGTTSFYVYADANGKVADIQNQDGIHTEHKYDITHDTVHNSKGTVLPSTGGAGTMKMITIGTMVALAFAVLLITHKKMTAYQD